MNRNFALAVLLPFCAANLVGQAQSGTVVGTVTDQGGAVVPGATVTLTGEATQFTRTAVTNVPEKASVLRR